MPELYPASPAFCLALPAPLQIDDSHDRNEVLASMPMGPVRHSHSVGAHNCCLAEIVEGHRYGSENVPSVPGVPKRPSFSA